MKYKKHVWKLNLDEVIKQNRELELLRVGEKRLQQLFEDEYIHKHANWDDIMKKGDYLFVIRMLKYRVKQLQKLKKPSISMLANSIQGRRTANDVFYTPIPLAKRHIQLVRVITKYNKKLTWYDPFMGTGNYYNNFPKNTTSYWAEITNDRDFFKYNPPTQVGIICSNPPYSILNLVFEQSVKLKPLVISFLIGFHNYTPKRIKYMNENGYGLVHVYRCNVDKWFSTSAILTFYRGAENIKGIHFDTVRYKS